MDDEQLNKIGESLTESILKTIPHDLKWMNRCAIKAILTVDLKKLLVKEGVING